MLKKTKFLLPFPLLFLSLLANIFLFQKTESGYEGELVVEVVDGDSFFIENRQPIRLYGLNAPKLEFCYGGEAKQKLEELISGRKVILAEPLTDRTGRVMALVYVDGLLVNEVMIREGFALSRGQGGSATDQMKAANEYARENHLGIFSPECYQPDPVDPDCVIKGNINRRQKDGIYFLPDCGSYDQVIIERFEGEQYFCSEKEAREAGFAKSGTCR